MGAGNTEDAGGARSDTIMLVNIPANRKRVVAVSFPRDLAITPMKCEAWNAETGEYGPLYDEDTETYGPDEVYTETKLNSAYSFGGPKCLVKVIQKLSGLSINRFMAVDFAGFSKMVDALGGVEVCSTTPLEDYELGTVLANAGRQIVDGHTALQLRARPPGDHRDQRRLRPHQAPAAVPVVAAALDDLQGSVLLAQQAQQRGQHVHQRQLRRQHQDQGPRRPRPVHAGRRRGSRSPSSRCRPRDTWTSTATRHLRERRHPRDVRRDHQRRPAARGEERRQHPGARHAGVDDERDAGSPTSNARPATTRARPTSWSTPSPPIRRTSPCSVSNSTGEDGLAATAAKRIAVARLQRRRAPTTTRGPLTSTTVFFSPGNEQAAATVASAFTNPTIERVTGMGDTVQVVLGCDFYSVTPAVAERLAGAGPRRARHRQRHRHTCPRI